MKTHRALRVLLSLAVLFLAAGSAFAAWPAKPINVIVPWSPGGASDLTGRTLAAEMEKTLGVRISVTNTPGGAGAIGTQAMFDAPRDGQTWSANADGSIVTYQALDMLKASHKDYASFMAVFTPNVICVPAASPYATLADLMKAMKEKAVTVASAGTGSGGHQAAEFFRMNTGLQYRHVPYQGGAPAVTATVRGEVETIMQLSMEVTEMLRAKQLRALAVMDSEPLEVEGYGSIPPITQWVPKFPSVGNRFGFFIPKDIPAEALEAITKAFTTAVNSPAIKKFAADRGSKVVSIFGADAEKEMDAKASGVCWLLFEAGVIKNSPEKYGIAKP